MYPYVPGIIVATLAVIGLGRAALKFDRKMVEAGKRRRLESEARANAQPVTGTVVQFGSEPAAAGATEYNGHAAA